MKDNIIYKYWGKASKEDGSYHLLVYHSLDVAAVGYALLNKHPLLLSRLSRLMSVPEKQTLLWCVFLLGIHDLGKFAESFQQLREDLRRLLWSKETILHKNYSVRHDSMGMMLWSQLIRGALFSDVSDDIDDFTQDVMPDWLAAVFGHHGWPPLDRERIKKHFKHFDQQAALSFFETWYEFMQPEFDQVAQFTLDKNRQEEQKKASWLIAGIAVLCDWLGSNTEFFEYNSKPDIPLKDYWENHAFPAAEKAIDAAGIIPSKTTSNQQIGDIFPYIKTATPLQQTCTETLIHSEPQLFILEDVTGAGKTEAAVVLAHRLIDAGLAQGIYIGLPTMATANAMYNRMVNTYERLFTEDASPSLILSHSARHLSERFQQSLLPKQKQNQNYADEENITAQCNRWLADNRKKALLADVGIGTIDQALLGVMPARHQSLRLLGLLNKVLILDEVHAYDAYTSEPLKKLIQFHSAFGGSTILLSATLTKKQRKQLISAFHDFGEVSLEKIDYPLLTRVSASKMLDEIPLETRELVKREVKVAFCYDESKVTKSILEAVNDGQCVCWIRNTVSDARDAWQMLKESGQVEKDKLHLFHSRYALCDRLNIEERMLALFGNTTDSDRTGHVLIATQVVEQSLDLDFDAMISDLAPIDLLIQRAGRLHRHRRGTRGMPVLQIFSPPATDIPEADWYKSQFPKAQYVYPHILTLWRTAQILTEKQGWRMPEDARELLEYVYDSEGDIPEGLIDSTLAVEGNALSESDAGAFASLRLESGYGGTDRWDEDARVATRLGEESHTVYLARWEDGELLPWTTGNRYRWDLSSLRVNYNQLSRLMQPKDDELNQVLDDLREREKLFDEHSFILPLTQQNEWWIGSGLDDRDNTVDVYYSKNVGMKLERRS